MQGSKRRAFSFPNRGTMSRLFSGKVEESVRLRLVALVTFWLVALAVAWVGGSPWAWLGGGLAATCGHAFSWHRRHRSLGVWTVVMALLVMAMAVVMRAEILAALDGNWLPVAHFLLLVQAVASFDTRTRGGLYGGLALSGIVLFFASQQAFELSFGIFLLGYSALLMTFLATAFLEDESRAAQPRPPSKGLSLVGFWSGTVAAVLLFSVLAFLLLPRGESNAVGYQQVSILPITRAPEASMPQVQADAQPSAKMPSPETPDADTPSSDDSGSRGGGLRADKGTFLLPLAIPEAVSGQEFVLGAHTPPDPVPVAGGDDVVMHVRSPVASYWRGQVFDTFDGGSWHRVSSPEPDIDASYIFESPYRYTQSFFIHQAQPGTTFMGYHGVKVTSPEKALYRKSLGKGISYKVVSVPPELAPEGLRRDRPGGVSSRYYEFPSSMEWLPDLADQITAGANTGFDRAAHIVEYLRRNGRYDASAQDQLESSAPLDDFLLDGEAGTSVDFATANVMLARAAGLPARLATGYLPGERDLLSGAYVVRRDDAHAWAEVHFQEHGWVPFDGTSRPDSFVARGAAAGSQLAGLKYLFESSVGDDLLRAAVMAPSKLSAGLKDAFNGPASTALVAVVAGVVLVGLAWLSVRLMWRGRRREGRRWSYTHLSGGGRDEMLRIYGRAERLLRKKGVQARRPGQTIQDYVSRASAQVSGECARVEQGRGGAERRGAKEQLAWFTDAAWAAAYNPSTFSAQTVQEAKGRLSSLKAALG